jgi:hypothetical protein
MARAVWSTGFINIAPGGTTSRFYTIPDGFTMVLRNMTFTFGGTPNGHGPPVLQVVFGSNSAVIWTIGAANVQLRTYQWEGREVASNSGEGPFLPSLEATWLDGYSSFTANGFLLAN